MICRGWGVTVDSTVGEAISINVADGTGSLVIVGFGATACVGVEVMTTGWFVADSIAVEAAGAHADRRKKKINAIAAIFFIINPVIF